MLSMGNRRTPRGVTPAMPPAGTLDLLRRFVLGLLILGLGGTATELLLIGHYEGGVADGAARVDWHRARVGRVAADPSERRKPAHACGS